MTVDIKDMPPIDAVVSREEAIKHCNALYFILNPNMEGRIENPIEEVFDGAIPKMFKELIYLAVVRDEIQNIHFLMVVRCARQFESDFRI